MTQRQLLELLARQVRNRVLRGGAWINDGHICRVVARINYEPSVRFLSIGFRVVCVRRQHDTKTTT